MSKVVLRASMDENGGAFVKNDWAHTDAEILDYKNFSEALSTNNCHLLRRPGVGLSELAGSLRHGIEVLQLLKEDANATGFTDVLDAVGGSVLAALGTIDQKGPEVDRSKKKVQVALRTFFDWLEEQPDLYDKVKDCAIAGARIYLSSMALLQGIVLHGNIATWIEMIPTSTSDSKEFDAWKKDPANKTKMCAALATLLAEKKEEEMLWKKGGKGNGASATFGQRSAKDKKEDAQQATKKKKARDSSSESSASSKKNNKKDKKKKGGTKAKPSSSSSEEEPRGKKKKKQKKDASEDSSEKAQAKKAKKKQKKDDSDDGSAERARDLKRAREMATKAMQDEAEKKKGEKESNKEKHKNAAGGDSEKTPQAQKKDQEQRNAPEDKTTPSDKAAAEDA